MARLTMLLRHRGMRLTAKGRTWWKVASRIKPDICVVIVMVMVMVMVMVVLIVMIVMVVIVIVMILFVYVVLTGWTDLTH